MGEKNNIDKTAIVGYKTGRKITSRELVIGEYAKIRSGSVIYEGSTIGDYLETGHNAIIREENRIGDHLSIWSNSVIDYGCKIGKNVKIHTNVYVAQFTTIEDNVFLAPGVMIANDRYPAQPNNLQGPIIKTGARIGANATILPGVKIGEYALVGAGAVVANDVPPGAVVYGNPATVRKTIREIKDKMGRNPYADVLPKLNKIIKRK